jgi:hypothetical protein
MLDIVLCSSYTFGVHDVSYVVSTPICRSLVLIIPTDDLLAYLFILKQFSSNPGPFQYTVGQYTNH